MWKTRRRAVVPALHKKYVTSMVGMFGDCAEHGARRLEIAAEAGTPVEMENWFSRLALDIIGKVWCAPIFFAGLEQQAGSGSLQAARICPTVIH